MGIIRKIELPFLLSYRSMYHHAPNLGVFIDFLCPFLTEVNFRTPETLTKKSIERLPSTASTAKIQFSRHWTKDVLAGFLEKFAFKQNVICCNSGGL